MLKLVADENLDNRILLGLLLRRPDLDIKRVQDVGLSGSEDPVILEWAAHEGRILVTHDKRTMADFAYERVQAGQPMPGVFAIKPKSRVGMVIDDILTLVELSDQGEWDNLVCYVPL
jgi:predicted nuclease of predicted toxin-antitoxin system